MQIYGDLNSGNCLKVKWVCDYLAQPYNWIAVDIMTGENRSADFLALNPAGQVPVVVLDDGRPLAQSNAILRYLARASALIPADAYDAAKMDEWLFWEQYSHEPAIAVCRFQMVYQGKPAEARDPDRVRRGEAALALMQRRLEASRFLVGDAFTLADVALLAYTRLAPEGGFDLSPLPALRRWIGESEHRLGLPAAALPASAANGDAPRERCYETLVHLRIALMTRPFAVAAFAVLAFLAVSAAPAQAQATRTWVSGVGDDANPCSRTAPCKTFAGAISKTATNGEINCLDPAGFGAVTITKSITIDCEGPSNGGITASGVSAIVVTTGDVILRGLDLNGATTGRVGLNVSGGNVSLHKSRLFGFTTAGVRFTSTGSLLITNSTISEANVGVLIDGASAKATLRDVSISGGAGNGVTVSGATARATIDRTTIASNAGAGVALTSTGTVLLGSSTITGNGVGVSNSGGGTLYSFRNNQIGGNTSDGGPIPSFPGPGGPLQ